MLDSMDAKQGLIESGRLSHEHLFEGKRGTD